MSARDRRLKAIDERLERLPTPAAQAVTPFAGTILDAMDAAALTGPSWDAWRVFWAVVYALPLSENGLEVFRRCTGRQTPPTKPVREAWVIVGRRGGKSRMAALGATFAATRRDWRAVLAPGETGTIPLIAADRSQARVALGYVRGLVQLPVFAPLVADVFKERVEFTTGAAVAVHTASWRTGTRGFTVATAACDEAAFWTAEDTATPDSAIVGALRPAMATVPDALLLGASTPYARRGELFRAWEKHFGRDESDVLVWVAASLTMNPTLDATTVAHAFEDDPAAAAAEYGAEFRKDIESLFDIETLRAVTISGRRELPPVTGTLYTAFVDPSGGSVDSMTLGIAHAAGERAVLDVLRECRPPFSPNAVVEEFAAVLRSYGVTEVSGDRYGGEWPRERFAVHGITYTPSEYAKSDLYRELLPLVNGGRIELLEHSKLVAQLGGLERRVSRGGRDSIDHGPGGHDDVANAAAGAVVNAAKNASSAGPIFFGTLDGGPPVIVDPGPTPAPKWSEHCCRPMRRGERDDRAGEWLTCVICGAVRPLDAPTADLATSDPTREWGTL